MTIEQTYPEADPDNWAADSSEHVDIIVVGAGISGVCAGYHLQKTRPDSSYLILEGRAATGGTWDIFRYPGVRSDSDMQTLGFPFRPWHGDKAMADGPSILKYVRETAHHYGIDQHIRLGHRVRRASWSSELARWSIQVQTPTGRAHFTCDFIVLCSGYYDGDHGHSPQFDGADRFAGPIVHPQAWSSDLEYAGKQVVVIGSGATAVTLVPAMAKSAAHVTMLQRSPSYVLAMPNRDPLAIALRRILPNRLAHHLLRWKNVLFFMLFFNISRRAPKFMRKLLRNQVASNLGEDYDVDTHFNPRYDPWRERMCFVPDGDLFESIRTGRASIVTDQIDAFTETGIRLASGEELDADIIVTATGLNLALAGGMDLIVDGRQVDLAQTLIYKGVMVSGVPNLALVTGYTNASWTLKCDLSCAYAARLLAYMARHGHTMAMASNIAPDVTPKPLIDFSSGYIQRSADKLPRQGSKRPWHLYQNYFRDIVSLRIGSIRDDAIVFSSPAPRSAPAPRNAPESELPTRMRSA